MRTTGLIDLEELTLMCKDKQSRDQLDEAISAYKAGAYRAAIVSTWIAVYFDFAYKIRSMSLSGHKAAAEWVAKSEQAWKKYDPQNPDTVTPLLNIERALLDTVSNDQFGLISLMELTDLQRLRSDRNRCAHPLMQNMSERFHPSAELSRMYIRQAVEYVLSRPALQGSLALDRFMSLINDEGFPTSEDDAVQLFRREQVLEGIRDQFVQRALENTLSGIIHSDLYSPARRRYTAALGAIRSHYRDRFEEPFTQALRPIIEANYQAGLASVVSMFSRTQWTWDYLDKTLQNRVEDAMREADWQYQELHVLFDALKSEGLEIAASDALASVDLEILVEEQEWVPIEPLLYEIVERLYTSFSYNETKMIIRSVLRPNISQLTSHHVRRILEAYDENDQVSEVTIVTPFLQEILRTCSKEQIGTEESWREVFPRETDWEGNVTPMTASIDRAFGIEEAEA